ncbi:sulfatase/phosphatase domain-containing protein [Enteractinococcus helveticum]
MVPEWNRPLDQRLQWYHDVDPVITAGPLHATVQQYLDDVEIPDPEFPDPPSPEADPYTPLNDDEWLRPALSSRVPLIITGPDHLVPKGRFANPVSLIDLLPTIVELADAPNAATAGTSLLEIAREEQNGQMGPQDRDVFVEYLAEGTHAPQITLVRGQDKYNVCPGDPDQLFDLETDPHELHKVADSQNYREIAQGLRSKLDTHYNF